MQRRFADIPTGATISGLEPAADDPNRIGIRVDGKAVATLTASEVGRLGLSVGGEWTESLSERVGEIILINKARQAALKMLSRRELSEKELTDRLLAKQHEEAIVERVLAGLGNDGWIDDRALAKAVVEAELAKKPAGHAWLVSKVQKRGIDHDRARNAADEALAKRDVIEDAATLAQRKLKAINNADASTPSDRTLRRVAGTLGRRGYDEQTIAESLRRLGLFDNEQVST